MAVVFLAFGAAVSLFLGVVCAIVVTGFLGFEAGFPDPESGFPPPDSGLFGEPVSGVGLACGLAFGLLPFLAITYAALRMFRSASWLDGTVLSVRGAFSTRARDLARARVRIGSRQLYRTVGMGDDSRRVPAGRMPMLEARSPGGGRWLATQLRDHRGDLLDAYQLGALADAITAGRRPEPYESEARQVANALREVAANPVHRLF